jgi:hypothetical protein
MPEEWKIMLQNSTITLSERLQNPQAVLDALDFYHHQQNKALSNKYMYSSEKSIQSISATVTPPRNTFIDKSIKTQSFINVNPLSLALSIYNYLLKLLSRQLIILKNYIVVDQIKKQSNNKINNSVFQKI